MQVLARLPLLIGSAVLCVALLGGTASGQPAKAQVNKETLTWQPKVPISAEIVTKQPTDGVTLTKVERIPVEKRIDQLEEFTDQLKARIEQLESRGVSAGRNIGPVELYRRLLPRARATNFPIYCVDEGHNNERGEVIEQIYIINKRINEQHTDKTLRDFLKQDSADQSKIFDPAIQLRWTHSEHRVEVTEDVDFNRLKGKLEITRLKGEGERAKEGDIWTIRIAEIEGGAILRVKVTTDLVREVEPDSRASLPFKISYSGEDSV
jgi:hypothetical protein